MAVDGSLHDSIEAVEVEILSFVYCQERPTGKKAELKGPSEI